MKKKTNYRTAVALLTWSLLSLVTVRPAVANDTWYMWCYQSAGVGGDKLTRYYSWVFKSDGDTNDAGQRVGFSSYVEAKFSPKGYHSSAGCTGPYHSFGEAEQELTDDMGKLRRDGWRVVPTRWTYSGD